MASLSVRKIDAKTLSALRVRAAKKGVSMEEEARQILKQAVSSPYKIGDIALKLFGSELGTDLKLHKRTPHKPLDLDE
jgi:antitoxin FitA